MKDNNSRYFDYAPKIGSKEKASGFTDTMSELTELKTTKIILYSLGALLLVGVSGIIFKIIKFSAKNYREMVSAIKGKP